MNTETKVDWLERLIYPNGKETPVVTWQTKAVNAIDLIAEVIAFILPDLLWGTLKAIGYALFISLGALIPLFVLWLIVTWMN